MILNVMKIWRQSATKLSGKPQKEYTMNISQRIFAYNKLVSRYSRFCINKQEYLVLCFSVSWKMLFD